MYGRRGAFGRGRGGFWGNGPTCFNCGRPGHVASQCWQGNRNGAVNQVCACCGRAGHFRAACRQHIGDPRRRNMCCGGNVQGQQPVRPVPQVPVILTDQAAQGGFVVETLRQMVAFTAASTSVRRFRIGVPFTDWEETARAGLARYNVLTVSTVQLTVMPPGQGNAGGLWIATAPTGAVTTWTENSVSARPDSMFVTANGVQQVYSLSLFSSSGNQRYTRHTRDGIGSSGLPRMEILFWGVGLSTTSTVRVRLEVQFRASGRHDE